MSGYHASVMRPVTDFTMVRLQSGKIFSATQNVVPVQVFGRRHDETAQVLMVRRPKSAKARNRGGRWCGGGAAGYGYLAAWFDLN